MGGYTAGKQLSWDLHKGGLTFLHSRQHVNVSKNYRPFKEKSERLIRRERSRTASVKGPGKVWGETALPSSHWTSHPACTFGEQQPANSLSRSHEARSLGAHNLVVSRQALQGSCKDVISWKWCQMTQWGVRLQTLFPVCQRTSIVCSLQLLSRWTFGGRLFSSTRHLFQRRATHSQAEGPQ